MSPGFPFHAPHDQAVLEISKKVEEFHAAKTPFRIYHGSTSSTRVSPYRHNNIVNISRLNHVLGVDTTHRVVYAEPNVPMDLLVDSTLKYDLLPPVVMEFPGITVGGGFSGTSGESSSFRHGLFHRTVQQVEIVLGNGEIVVASESLRSDLFHGAACSFGTLGIVTLLAIRLVPATSFVSLTYIRVHSIDEAIERTKVEQENERLDYLDGMLFARDRGVLCLGSLVSGPVPETEIMQFSRPWDEWFYINAEKRSLNEESWNEIIPIRDYLFRYDRGAFWMGKYTYRYFAVPFNMFTRWLLDRYTHTRLMYHALHRSGLSEQFVIQDIAIPYANTSRFVEYLDTNFQQYPLWICPLRVQDKSVDSTYGLLAEKRDDVPREDMMMSIGVWGEGHTEIAKAIEWNKALECEIENCGGEKWLYAHTFYSKEKFWSMFDQQQRDELRLKYHASHLPTLYDKVKVNYGKNQASRDDGVVQWLLLLIWGIWPIKGLYGWLQCIIEEEHLLPKRKQPVFGG
ncbi:related to 24-dehydrocholesterol reductase precursor [Ramularia collo-cygni]|uniref:Delta(24)-sterol reductase n=1 Tax=Ramularia collo-cygni TaxID=112498 RepID=A0A2D3UR80_9PEZI|nr:related to 24-dehydrocholesterol reductase precursor [Ramularia collo-cygni]CZT18431.1 related to 24-dehydrocholesterol reductase precursor [Ramularia collo-cygni]